MRVRSMALIAACMLAGAGSSAAVAQTTTQTLGLDDCRAQAVSKGLVGDALNKSISDCIGRPVSPGATTASASGARFTTCRTEARAKFLTGDALNAALDDCMAQSGAPAEASNRPTYQDCRSRAVSRSLTGDALSNFIDSCLSD
jgi:hypothetical protein